MGVIRAEWAGTPDHKGLVPVRAGVWTLGVRPGWWNRTDGKLLEKSEKEWEKASGSHIDGIAQLVSVARLGCV